MHPEHHNSKSDVFEGGENKIALMGTIISINDEEK
jgi:hypothetical protein